MAAPRVSVRAWPTRPTSPERHPLLVYDWKMVDRDIEQLGLVPFRQNGDPSHHVFPWQDLEGKPLPAGAPKTRPQLRRGR